MKFYAFLFKPSKFPYLSKNFIQMKNLILLSLAIFIFSNCKNKTEKPAENTDQLGTISLNVTCGEDARPHFEKGLKLLHNFEYEDAATAFIKAQEVDSTCALAYWGEAMTYNHPLWRQQDFEKGQEALNKLASTPEARAEAAGTELEKDLLASMEIMYGDKEVTKKTRDSLYSVHLEKLYEKYPDNHEVATFYALSIMGAVKFGWDVDAAERSAQVVKGVIEENPEHPGALHYLIHSYDDPGHAPLALPAARAYSVVAADAAHALHMPSHIFVSVGMWDETIKSNIASWDASVKWVADRENEENFGSYHALHWWMYGLTQKGQYEEAKKLLADMSKYFEEKPTKRAARYMSVMKANYLAETGEWTGDAADFPMEIEDINIATRAQWNFIEGMKKYAKEDASGLGETIAFMEKERIDATRQVTETGAAMCSAAGSNQYAPNQSDIDEAKVFELQLRALLAKMVGTEEQEEDFLKEATAMENEISYSFGPPHIAWPTYEQYGQWLLDHDRPEDAAKQFDISLEKGPKRRRALMGRLEAAKKMEDTEKISELEEILGEISLKEI